MKTTSILASVLLVLLFAAGVTYLLQSAPDFICKVKGTPREDAAICTRVKNARVTITSAIKDPESAGWKFKCKIQGRDAVLSMAAIKSQFHPSALVIGHTYKLDYHYMGNPANGIILWVHDEVR